MFLRFLVEDGVTLFATMLSAYGEEAWFRGLTEMIHSTIQVHQLESRGQCIWSVAVIDVSGGRSLRNPDCGLVKMQMNTPKGYGTDADAPRLKVQETMHMRMSYSLSLDIGVLHHILI
ncbi:hypothetical protein QQ045_008912 [Rhodiola kirilowii]